MSCPEKTETLSNDSEHTSVLKSFSEPYPRVKQSNELHYKEVAILIFSHHPLLIRGAKVATMKRITHVGEECCEAHKDFVHSECFADCRIPHDNVGRHLSLQFCSEMIWTRLLWKTVTELKLDSWVSDYSPGNVGGTSILSFQAPLMMPFCCSELAALEQKGCFYCQILPIKKSLVYHPAVVCLSSSVLCCLLSASQSSDDFKISVA